MSATVRTYSWRSTPSRANRCGATIPRWTSSVRRSALAGASDITAIPRGRARAGPGSRDDNRCAPHRGRRADRSAMSGFRARWEVSLLEGLGPVPKGYYFINGGPTIARGKIVVGAAVGDNQKWGEPSGVIRAFDVTTGQLSWAYDVGAPNRIGAPPPGEIYARAIPNSWAQMAYDDKLGRSCVPTGYATPDHGWPAASPDRRRDIQCVDGARHRDRTAAVGLPDDPP